MGAFLVLVRLSQRFMRVLSGSVTADPTSSVTVQLGKLRSILSKFLMSRRWASHLENLRSAGEWDDSSTEETREV